MVKAIFFDLGGVLVTDLFPLMESYLSGITGIVYPKVKEVRKQYWMDYELGRLSGVDFMQKWISDLGSTVSPEELLAKSCSLIKLKEETVEVLKKLKSTGKYDLGVISNNTDEWSAYAKDDLGLGEFFDAWVISSHHQIKNPDKEIYLLAAEQLGLKTEDCLFIDNMQRNIQGAKAAGMKGIWFKDATQLLEDLRKSGIEF